MGQTLPRGFIWCVYFDDNADQWALLVNGTYFTHVERGWQSVGGPFLNPLPRQWRPRRVFGFDSTGHRQFAVVPHTDTLLWTGQSSSFSVLGNDGALEIVDVAGRQGEFRVPMPPD